MKKYVDDPLCGFAFSNELARDISVGLARMHDPALEARIPKSLPVLVIQVCPGSAKTSRRSTPALGHPGSP